MGGYLVTVTDTDTKDPVANAAVTLRKDNSISIRLPNSRLLDYADQTTVTVQLVKDKRISHDSYPFCVFVNRKVLQNGVKRVFIGGS